MRTCTSNDVLYIMIILCTSGYSWHLLIICICFDIQVHVKHALFLEKRNKILCFIFVLFCKCIHHFSVINHFQVHNNIIILILNVKMCVMALYHHSDKMKAFCTISCSILQSFISLRLVYASILQTGSVFCKIQIKIGSCCAMLLLILATNNYCFILSFSTRIINTKQWINLMPLKKSLKVH